MKRFLAALCVCASLVSGLPAHSVVLIVAEEVGTDVVFTGSGAFDTAGLVLENGFASPLIAPGDPGLTLGAAGDVDLYGPMSSSSGAFGGLVFRLPDAVSGDTIGLSTFALAGGGTGAAVLPDGYVSGTELAGTMTFFSQTIASLDLARGVYTYAFGNGESIVLQISAVVPLPATLVLMLTGMAGLGVAGLRRRRRA